MPVSAKVVHCIPRVVTSLTKLRCDLFPVVGSPVQGPTICWGEHKIFSHVYFYDALKINRLFLVFKSSLHHFFLLLHQTPPPSNPALEGASAAPELNESPWPWLYPHTADTKTLWGHAAFCTTRKCLRTCGPQSFGLTELCQPPPAHWRLPAGPAMR